MPSRESESALERALREHEELQRLIRELRSFLEKLRPPLGDPGCHTWAASLSKHVARLHDMIFRHFRDEEQEGLFENLARRHPGAREKVSSLRQEHSAILAAIREMMSATLRYSEGQPLRDPRLRHRMIELLDAIARHEQNESELIVQIEYSDPL